MVPDRFLQVLSQTGKLLLKLLAGRRTARQYSHGPDVLFEDIRRDVFVHPILPTGKQVLGVISITAHLARGSDHCFFASEGRKRVRRYPESIMLPLAEVIDQWPVSHESIHLRLVFCVPRGKHTGVVLIVMRIGNDRHCIEPASPGDLLFHPPLFSSPDRVGVRGVIPAWSACLQTYRISGLEGEAGRFATVVFYVPVQSATLVVATEVEFLWPTIRIRREHHDAAVFIVQCVKLQALGARIALAAQLLLTALSHLLRRIEVQLACELRKHISMFPRCLTGQSWVICTYQTMDYLFESHSRVCHKSESKTQKLGI